jgi:hypothetical protein
MSQTLLQSSERRGRQAECSTVLAYLIRSTSNTRGKRIKSSVRLGCAGKRNYQIVFFPLPPPRKMLKNN